MAWLIVRIEPRDNDVKPEGQGEPVVASLRKRVSLKKMMGERLLKERVPVLAKEHGFEVDLPLGGHSPEEWPFIAYIYTSLNKDGHGRSGSILHRWPARRIPA
jgi:hypothetical protein